MVKIFRSLPVKDSDGNLIGRTEKVYATYTYDAWGKLIGITDRNGDSLMNKQATSSALANRNPLRYRGYYYDVETGFYYLQSRYYDPANHRFINADVYTSTDSSDAVSCNMFAYCGNNPTSRSDETGEVWFVSFLVGVAEQYAQDVVGNLLSGKHGWDILKPTSSVGEYVASGVTNLIPGASHLTKNLISEGICMVEKKIKGQDVDIKKSAMKVIGNTLFDCATDKVSGAITNYVSSKSPRNYSQYAHKLRQTSPELTRQEISQRLRRTSQNYYTANRVIDSSIRAAEWRLKDKPWS